MTQPDLAKINDNIRYRIYVQDLLQLVEIEHLQNPIFWLQLHRAAEEKVRHLLPQPPPVPKPHAMTDQEARDFEQTTVPFGEHKGRQVSEIPLDYWLFLTENEFSRQLFRYVRSDRFQRLQS